MAVSRAAEPNPTSPRKEVGVSEAESSSRRESTPNYYTKGGDPFGADGDGEATGFAGGSLVKQRTSGFSK